MKKIVSTVLVVILLLVGLGLMAYPSVSNWWNSTQTTKVVAAYENVLNVVDLGTIDFQLEQARQFNEKIVSLGNRWNLSLSMREQYYSLLDISGTGLMCMLSIPRLNVELPVYHGDADDVLQVACGHMEGTSLPVGGKATHVVISGHTGLPSAELLTGLDTMEVGDRFILETLGQKLVYEVSEINIVLPSEMGLLDIREDADLVTLLTCTPYGVNSHRLLVTGSRVEFESEEEADRAVAELEAGSPITPSRIILIVVAIGLLLALAVTAFLLRRWIKGR